MPIGKFIVNNVVLIFIILVAGFLYFYNLSATQPFIADTARDTLRMLEIWQNKEITLIGPPLSIGLGTTREIYFSSLSLYFGIIGLIFTNFDPIGAVVPNIILFLLSIPAFYALMRRLDSNVNLSLFATALFAWSPAIVHHARFFWNPNSLIPLSVFFWLCVTLSNQINSRRFRLLYMCIAGLILGLMFDFHYLGIISGVLVGLWLILNHQIARVLAYIGGFILGASPLIIFELRNNYYLLTTFWWNIANNNNIFDLGTNTNRIISLGTAWLSVLGFTHTEVAYPLLVKLSVPTLIVLVIILLVMQIIMGWKIWISRHDLHPYILVLLLTIIIFAPLGVSVYTRYLWGIYPILFWLLAQSIYRFKSRYLIIIILLFILGSSWKNISTPRSIADGVVPLTDLALAGRLITDENISGSYNISESITGDARGTALRYYVQRDARIKPLNQSSYKDLDHLFILAPSLEDVYKGARWEFTATPGLKLTKTYTVSNNYLFKFSRVKE